MKIIIKFLFKCCTAHVSKGYRGIRISSILLLLSATGNFHVNAQWQVQATYPEGTKTFKEIFFFDENSGWVADETGPYLYTTDGGENWYENPGGEYANDVVFTSIDTGFICYAGEIYKTSNGGQDWSVVLDYWSNIIDLSFADSENGWAVWDTDFGIVLSTENSGISWADTYVFSDMLEVEIYTLDLVAKDTGWVYMWRIDGAYNEYTEIYKTEDGGDNWILKHDSPSRNLKFDMFFTNDTTGWLAGGSSGGYKLLNTSDNGKIWIEQELINGENIGTVSCICFTNDTTGWLGTANENLGYIYYTTDAGNSWNRQAEYDKPIYDIFLINKNEGWAIGKNTIYHYNNPDSTEEPEEEDFNISPNPCKDNLVLHYTLVQNTDVIIQIFDITGKQVLYKTFKNQTIGNNRQEINISDLRTGLYLVSFYDNKQTITKKIIVLGSQ